jgi:hypothetical protein
MYRVLPVRWLQVLYFPLMFGLLGAVISIRFAGSGVAPADAVIPGAIGLGLGAFVALALLLSIVERDTRLLAVRAMLPHAIVVQAFRNDETADWLAELSKLLASQLAVKAIFTVAFDRSGVTVWSGARVPLKVVEIAWRDVVDVKLGDLKRIPGYGQQPYSRLRLDLKGNDAPLSVQFGVERVAKLITSQRYLSESELIDLASRVNSMRLGGALAPATPTSNVSRGLTPGRTALAAQRFPFGFRLANPFAYQALVLCAIASGLLHLPLWVSISLAALALATVAVMLIAAWLMSRASKRESAAGYTTLNGAYLALEQRNPRTGVVIRAAGTRALSRREFADALRR